VSTDAWEQFEVLRGKVTALADSGEEGRDEAFELLQEVLWWALGQGARDDGPNAGYLVTLARSVKDGAAERTLTALAMVKGVAHVEPVPQGQELAMAEARVKAAMMDVAVGHPQRTVTG
jgi:hypothetical protein